MFPSLSGACKAVLTALMLTITCPTSAPPNFPQTFYATLPDGVSASPTYFPIAVWLQNPISTATTNGANLAEAAANEKINLFEGINSGGGWPEAFGNDNGELRAVQAAGLHIIAGGDPAGNTSSFSVASILSLISHTPGSAQTVWGYDIGDEPSTCAEQRNIPGYVAAAHSYDPTRVVLYNQGKITGWQFSGCAPATQGAYLATDVASFDQYPTTDTGNPSYFKGTGQALYDVDPSDFNTKPMDLAWLLSMWSQQGAQIAGSTRPYWAYIESGSDVFGSSAARNTVQMTVTNGSAAVVLTGSDLFPDMSWPAFSKAWVGLSVTGAGIPASTTISGVTDATHATLSHVATASGASESVTLTGFPDNDCVAATNVCLAQGNEYRTFPYEVNAEVWMSIINGALGIQYFCHDSASYSYCLGDSAAAGASATLTANNLTYIDSTLNAWAEQLNLPTIARCSMQNQDFTISPSCSNGLLTMATSNVHPGLAMVKHDGAKTYLFAMMDRRATSSTNFTFTLTGLAGKVATVAYDSNAHYDQAHSNQGATFTLDSSGAFSDPFGQGAPDMPASYEVKIYTIQ